MLTRDGKGIFYAYNITTTQEAGFGYYDIASRVNDYPLFQYSSSTAVGTPLLVGALDANNLLYGIEPNNVWGSGNVKLYDGSTNGSSTLVDNSWRGFDLISFLQAAAH